MSTEPKQPKPNQGLTATQKISLVAGSLPVVLYLLPSPANAAIIYVGNDPVSLALGASVGTSVEWDVDGVNGSDFRLFRKSQSTYGIDSIQFGSDGSNGRGLIAPFSTDNVQALLQSFTVGPTLANYVWGLGSYRYRAAMSSNGNGAQIGFDWNFGFAEGDNYFGFRFNGASGLYYGWATINFDTTNGIVTIKEWAYNDVPDGAIHVPDGLDTPSTPEPSSSLALLAMGAAGVYRWRKKRKSAQVEEDMAA